MSFSLGSLFDPAGITTGDAGNMLNALLDPAGGIANNFGIDRGPLSDWYDQTSEYFDNQNAFEMSQLSDWGQRLKNNPFKFFVAGTPLSTKVWNEALGKDWDPAINQFGGPAKETYQSAEEKGIDTSNAQGSHAVAQAIASAYGGSYIGEAAGAGYAGMAGDAAGGVSGAAADTAGAIGSGATIGAANALDNGTDVWSGAGHGALGGFLGSGFDYGDSLGISDPTYKKMFNSTVSGAAKAGASGSNVGRGALTGFVGGAAPIAAQKGGTMLGDMFDPDKKLAGDSYDPTAGGNFGGTATANKGETGYSPFGQVNNVGLDAGISSFGGQPTPSPSTGNSPNVTALINAFMGGSGDKAGGLGGMAGSLMGLYGANQQRKRLREQQGQLSNLFSPNSPYAQQMRQQLERRDAAAGRRSQYGPREAQMMAALADRQAQVAPHQMQLNQAMGGQENAMMNNGLRLGQQLYNSAPQIQQGYNGLMNMFNGGY